MDHIEQNRVFLTANEVAAQLKVTTYTLARWRQHGDGPQFIKFPNGGIRYRPEDIDHWIDGAAA